MIFVKGTNKYGEMVVMWLLQLNVGLLLHVLRSSRLEPGSAVGEKGKTGSNRKNIGERSEPSGSLGREKWPDSFFLFPPMRNFSLSSFSPFVFFKKMQMGFFSQRGQLHNSTTLNVLNNKLET